MKRPTGWWGVLMQKILCVEKENSCKMGEKVLLCKVLQR